MVKISKDNVKQLGSNMINGVKNMKYQILTIILLVILLHYLNGLNSFHNP